MEWLKARLRRTRAYPRLLRLKKVPFYLRDRLWRAKRPPAKFCPVPWRESAVLCDGTVVCGCIDALKAAPLGNVERSSFLAIWQGRRYRRLRKAVLAGAEHVYLCSSCCFLKMRPVSGSLDEDYPAVPSSFPKQLHIEPTIRCNLRCPACGLELARLSRTRPDMPFDTFCRVIDEVGPHLERLCFYDYGESFLHPQAVDMLRYAKKVNPEMFIVCSTNGHFLRTPEEREAFLDTGVDQVIFSVDGASQQVYEKYRVGGRFDLVVENMRALAAMKRGLGLKKPSIMWRYILFNWNDTDEEMNLARKLATEIGVDEIRWLTTDHPHEGWSRRFARGTPELERIRSELD